MLQTNKQKKNKQYKKNAARKTDTNRFRQSDELARQGYLTDKDKLSISGRREASTTKDKFEFAKRLLFK